MSAAIKRCVDEVIELSSLWDIGATGAHTKNSSIPGKGFASIARTAAGKYTVTFSADMPSNLLVGLEIWHKPAADAVQRVVRETKSSFSASAKTVLYEAWSIGTTPAQVELANGDQVYIKACFQKTK